MMSSNPYVSPNSIAEEVEAPDVLSDLLSLPLKPWGVRSLEPKCSDRRIFTVGFLAITLQCGLALSPSFGSIGEPYANLMACLWETISVTWLCLVLGMMAAAFVTISSSILPRQFARRFMLTCWSAMLLFVAWLVCHFCRVLDHPSYGILDDDRPAWMTNEVVLLIGMLATWAIVLLILFVLAVALPVFGRVPSNAARRSVTE